MNRSVIKLRKIKGRDMIASHTLFVPDCFIILSDMIKKKGLQGFASTDDFYICMYQAVNNWC